MIYFFDKTLQEKFERDGFVVVDLLNRDEVQQLRDFYFNNKESHLEVLTKMHSTCDTNNLDLILKSDELIKKIYTPKLDKILKSYESLLGGYLVKEIGENSETGFHQDPTLVNENKYISANVWVALQDTNSVNGNLRVIKGSHRMGDILVATPAFPTIFESFKDDLVDYATEIPVKAGQAIILDNKLIHGATENLTNEERIAVVMAIKSKAAEWSFYYLDPENDQNKVEKFKIDFNSFSKLVKNNRPPEAEFLGFIDHNFVQLSKDEFLKFMKDNNYRPNPLIKKLKSLIRR